MPTAIAFSIEGECRCCNRCTGDPVASYDVPNDRGWETYVGNLRLADGGGPIGLKLECRNRGGTATLCGFNEFTGYASTPPKKYRTLTFSGNTLVCNHLSGPCVTPTDSGYSLYSGSRFYDKDTCATSTTGNDRTLYQQAPGCAAAGGNFNGTFVTAQNWDSPTGIVDTVRTSTVWSQDGNGVCYGSNNRRPPGNVRTQTLTDEDTEDDAINRLLAGAGGTWTTWTTTGDGTAGTCIATTCCRAEHVVRTSGFSFGYREAQWRIAPTGNTAAAGCYYVDVTYYRRAPGVGAAWEEYATGSTYVAVDGSGNAVMYPP